MDVSASMTSNPAIILKAYWGFICYQYPINATQVPLTQHSSIAVVAVVGKRIIMIRPLEYPTTESHHEASFIMTIFGLLSYYHRPCQSNCHTSSSVVYVESNLPPSCTEKLFLERIV
eukprot:Filipodium_phascolosomae@DN2437_c0_g1_i1.p1